MTDPGLLLLLFAAALLLALALVPLGLPGTWAMLGAAFGYNALAAASPGAGRVGTVTLAGTFVLAASAEVVEWVVGARAARRSGGSRRAGWGAMVGGLAGAVVGVPVPVVGSVLGALAGSFAGAFAAELTTRRGAGAATRVAAGALVGQVVAAALKTAAGVVIAVWLLVAVLASR